ncbi:50S ribosomal protein L18 [Candidatus Bandiella euplotis]|uniref:Large ribosomal subunit protein uL18 n=1 Tax=Candidatus Bandiella euplotis TaxID=1664265 RepID=A0ABZ0UNC2_9RICK|nr:50S ribosomal protein L18 [Candidatus Bandiella woodruffii]WPX96766.1 50S ribosomal protein L18 [Candidatus Bandiella woodruffii]
MLEKRLKAIRRKERTRYKLKKNSSIHRIRLCFYTSNQYIYGQVINDNEGRTITSFATYHKDFSDLKRKNNTKAAAMLGEKVAKALVERNIKDVYFDRGQRIYHGKAKAFAESARQNGLNF